MSQEVEKIDNFKNCHYDRCCNPLKLDHHIKKNGLVKVSKKIRDIYTHLNDNELVCTSVGGCGEVNEKDTLLCKGITNLLK